MTTEELIAALERAEGPSRELDWAIGHACQTVGRVTLHRMGREDEMQTCAPYTSSLDAALTLVPEGWRWSLDWTQRPPYQNCGRSDLYAPGNGIEPPDVSDVYAATPALALCIAALKARAA